MRQVLPGVSRADSWVRPDFCGTPPFVPGIGLPSVFSRGPHLDLQMTQFRFVLWLSNIPLYICTTSSLSIRLSMDT